MFFFRKRRASEKKRRLHSHRTFDLPTNQLAFSVELLEMRCLLSAAPTTIDVAISTNTLSYGQTVNLTATVTSTLAPSEGTVLFTDGSTTLGTASVSHGTANLNGVYLPTGVDVITASYTDSLGSFGNSQTTLGASSIIRTMAGIGNYSGDGGPATLATMNRPGDVAVDSAGDIFIADYLNNQIREVNAVTQVIASCCPENIFAL